MYSIAYFSPTGNTRFVAKELKKELNDDNTQFIDIIHNDGWSIKKNEHLIILFSIHAFNVPQEVIKFIKCIPKGIFKKVSIIAVGCNTSFVNDAASVSLRKVLNEKEYNVVLDRVIAMPLTIVKKLPDEINTKTILSAKEEIKKVSKDIKRDVIDKKDISLGSKSVAFLGKSEKYAARLFGLELYANNKCISCGLCWSQCPSKNIIEKNNKPKFKFKCSMCMRCIYNCPVDAINPYMSKFLPLKNGYSLNEMLNKSDIKANVTNLTMKNKDTIKDTK